MICKIPPKRNIYKPNNINGVEAGALSKRSRLRTIFTPTTKGIYFKIIPTLLTTMR